MNYLFTQTPLKFFIQSFWRDEAFSYLLAQKSIIDILYHTAQDFNPPLYYLLLHFWMGIFGHSEIAMRTLSLVFFWATIYISFDFMHDVLHISYKRAIPYMFLMILSPILIYYGFEARMYTMLSFFAALSYYALHTNRKRMHTIALILGMFTHYFMIFVVICQALYLVITKKRDEKFIEVFKHFIIAGIVFLPWIAYVYSQKSGSSDSFWIPIMKFKDIFIIPGIIYTGFETFLDFAIAKKANFVFSIISITIILLAIVISGYLKLKLHDTRKKQIYLSLLLWAFLPPIFAFIVSFIKPIFLPRYLIASSVGLLLLAIYSLELIRPKARIVLAILLVVLTLQHLRHQLNYRSKTNMAQTFSEINSLADEDDVVYVISELDFFTAQYYFDTDRVFIYNKSYNEIPDYVGKTLIPEDKIVSNLPIYPRKAFIIRGNRQYDITAAY